MSGRCCLAASCANDTDQRTTRHQVDPRVGRVLMKPCQRELLQSLALPPSPGSSASPDGNGACSPGSPSVLSRLAARLGGIGMRVATVKFVTHGSAGERPSLWRRWYPEIAQVHAQLVLPGPRE